MHSRRLLIPATLALGLLANVMAAQTAPPKTDAALIAMTLPRFCRHQGYAAAWHRACCSSNSTGLM
jgi:hypothetical protein